MGGGFELEHEPSKKKRPESGEIAGVQMNGVEISQLNSSQFDSPMRDENVKVAPAKSTQKKVSVLQLFRFADHTDKIIMLFGFIFAVLHGTAIQVNYIILSEVTDIFVDAIMNQNNTNTTDEALDALLDEVPIIAAQFCANSTAVLIFGYLHMMLWVRTADRQIRVIRRNAFHNILTQHMGYFDKNKSGQLVTCLTEDIATFQAGMGDKVATFIQWVSTFVVGAIICLVRGWKLTMVILCVAPVAAGAGAVVARTLQKVASKEMMAYGRAGSVAEEVLSAIRIVAAYCGEKKEIERYEVDLKSARKVGITKGLVSGCGQGMVWVIAFGIIALAFWYGGELVEKDEVTAGFVLQVQFAMFVGMRSLGWSVGSLEAISAARGAASGVYAIIDAVSEIDSSDRSGETPSSCEGNITFKDVTFHYPMRKDVTVLKGLTLEIKKGQTIAFVGPSGCGKSTTIQLIQRYYDAITGTTSLDGRDVTKLNIKWLRQQIGVVSQEPILFAATLKQNIQFGRDGVTDEEIKAACVEANAHDFIMKLPQAYDTMMSEMGTQLSRGQKQRISLARALVRNPRILLLDECTSALDNESEAIVQAALEKASKGRTTIVIAHRLSTVKNSDVLFVIDKGVVAEYGNHDELMNIGGVYANLVARQVQANADDEEVAKSNKNDEITKIEKSEDPVQDNDPKEAEETERLLKEVPEVEIKEKKRMKESEAGEYEIIADDDIDMKMKRRTTTTGSQKSGLGGEHEEEEEIESEYPPPAIGRIYALNRPELPLMIVGGICAMLQGCIFPSLAVLFGEILGAFAIPDKDERQSEINFYVVVIAVTGMFAGIFTVAMVYLFNLSGERLTYRLRVMAFTSMLTQEIGWFDEKENQVGTLTSRLANDASRVKGATGTALCSVINASSTAGFSLIIGFIFGWKLAIVISLFLPLLIIVGMLQTQMMTGFARGNQKAVEDGGKICAEGIDKVRTVAALTKEEWFEEKYNQHFDVLFAGSAKKANLYGITWGVSQCLIYFAFATSFGFGGYLVGVGQMEFQDVFRVFIAICAGGVEIGRVNAAAPEYSKAKVAASKLFALFDRPSLIDPFSNAGKKPEACNALVNFNQVRFNYPTRPEVEVLKGIDLSVRSGQFIALVGSSGCGKTTIVQLLERFYDVDKGSVTLDNHKVSDLNIMWLRQQMAIVTQDPILFGTSIKDNIAYGDNTREVGMAEVVAAAKGANIHNFISTLPQGYETNVGSKGTQLSGGQKQRVSIARALVRNPKILILDDATSALDSESEKVVQEALDKAQVGRTSIVIAHRLSSIVTADIICYVERGEIVESGTHVELMAKKSYYFNLQQMYLGNKEN